jgi:Ca2+-binding RTX toxin-like protein
LGYLNFTVEHDFELGLLGVDIRDMVVRESDGELYLYTSTSLEGGAAAYRLVSDSIPELVGTKEYSGASRLPVLHGVNIVTLNGNDYLVVGSNAAHKMTGYYLDDDGSILRRQSIDWGPVDNGATHLEFMTIGDSTFVATASENGTGISVFELSDTGTTLTFEITGSSAIELSTVASMECVTLDGNTFLITASTEQNEIQSFQVNASGELIPVDSISADDGLGIAAPTGMELVTVGDTVFAVVSSATSNSLSVLRLASDGALVATDHVLDTVYTRFEDVGELNVFTVDDHVFILASGSDDGLSIFTLLPNGRLHHLETVAWDGTNGLNSITAIEAVEVGNEVQVFVASGTGEGLFQFDFDITGLGDTLSGTNSSAILTGSNLGDMITAGSANDTLQGQNGDDILIDGTGADTFWGGSGADTFIMIEDAGETDTVMDFERGIDRLDLSNFSMLYSVDQITVLSTSYGARVTFRGEVFEIHSNDGYSLDAGDMFADSFWGPDRPFSAVVLPVADSDIYATPDPLIGTSGDDELIGTDGDDVLLGGDGGDILNGGAGIDRAQYSDADAGLLADLQYAQYNTGFAAGDTYSSIENLYGSIYADSLRGDAGNNTISGNDGNDLLYGREGDDTLYGMDDDDVLLGGDGADVLNGGAGADRAQYTDATAGLIADLLYAHVNTGFAAGDTYSSIENLYGTTYGDNLRGDNSNNVVWAHDGNDTLHGREGDDNLLGMNGDDVLLGGDGGDILNGGAGTDTLSGGEGADTFVFTVSDGDDIVTDYDPIIDQIEINNTAAINTSIVGSDLVITYGEGTLESTITLQGVYAGVTFDSQDWNDITEAINDTLF